MAKETDFEHPPRGHVATLYYDVANDRFQVVQGDDVDTAIPATAKAMLASSLAHGYDGTLWRKLALVWGYSARLAEVDSRTQSGGGNELVELYTVPSGYIAILNATMSRNRDTITTHEHILVADSTEYAIKIYVNNPVGSTAINDNVKYVLSEDDVFQVRYYACTNNDRLITKCWGSLMKVDM